MRPGRPSHTPKGALHVQHVTAPPAPGPRPIAPQITADGRAIRLPISERVAPLLDELAVAYAEDPATVGRLLTRHAAAALRLDHAVVSEDMPEWERSIRAAEADGTRDALTYGLTAADHLDAHLDPRAAAHLAEALLTRTALLAHSNGVPA